MLKLIKQKERVFIEDYYLNFDVTIGGGFSFPCDKSGKVNTNHLTPEAKENLRKCLEEIKTITPPYVVDYSYWDEIPEVRECRCGEPIDWRWDSEGIVYCDCGKMFNTSGSELRPRSEWEEQYDDDY